MFIGIDACKSGWIAALLSGDSIKLRQFESFRALLEALVGNAQFILIDIPIGLISKAVLDRREDSAPYRRCDLKAKMLLGRRASTIFHPPTREALQATNHLEASSLNKSITGKGLSIQAYGIAKKIGEVDSSLRQDVTLVSKIREFHPEIAFLNLGWGNLDRKKTEKGITQRIQVIQKYVADFRLEGCPVFRGVKKDDILDAAIGAVLAEKAFAATASGISNTVERDEFGLEMNIAYV